MIYIVGDIHGEITKLKSLVKTIHEKDKIPEFVFIGDYIDKGEDVKATLTFLKQLKKDFNCVFLLGNHEHFWLNLTAKDIEGQNYLLKYGAQATIRSLNAKGILDARQNLMDEFGDFFSLLKPYWKNDHFVAVHSGIKPSDYAIPIDDILVSELLFNRYDFLKQEKLYLEKYKVIFGHTGFYSPYVDPYKIGIDTAACFLEDQPLTAFCIDLNKFIDSSDRYYGLEEISLDICPNISRTKPWRE